MTIPLESIFDISPDAQDEYENSRSELIRYINLSPRDDAEEKLAELYAEDIDKIIVEAFQSMANLLRNYLEDDSRLYDSIADYGAILADTKRHHKIAKLVELYDVRLMA